MRLKVAQLQAITPNAGGAVEFTIDDIEDFYALANVLEVGDELSGQVRRVSKRSNAGTGKGKKDVQILFTRISVGQVLFQPGVDEMNVEGSLCEDLDIPDAKAGSRQNMLLRMGAEYILMKQSWDRFALDQLIEASDPEANAVVAVVLMQQGFASLCVCGRASTVVKAQVRRTVPKIRQFGAGSKGVEAKRKFFEEVAGAMKSHFRLGQLHHVLLASPGFLATEFLQFVTRNATEYSLQEAVLRGVFHVTSCASAQPQELPEVFARADVQEAVSQTKLALQTRVWSDFQHTIAQRADLVALGPASVLASIGLGAVAELLVADDFVRALVLGDRQVLMAAVDGARAAGTTVVTYSKLQEWGEQLMALGGIAARLRFAVPDEPVGFDRDA